MTSIKKLKKGEILEKSMVSFKNPGTGIAPKNASKYYGKTFNQDLDSSSLILPEMLD